MESNLKKWLMTELSQQLGLPVSEGTVEYLISMDTRSDVEDYLLSLLGKPSPDFIREFLIRWAIVVEERSCHGNETLVPLVRPTTEQLVLFESNKKINKKVKKEATKEAPPTTKQTPPITKQHALPSGGPPPGFTKVPEKKEGIKTKYVPLMSKEGESRISVKFPGRYTCQCLGQKHELINNCLECGRIVCSQEGSGPCLFCGNVIFTKHEEKLLHPESHRGEKTKDKILGKYGLKEVEDHHDNKEDLPTATRHRDKLLEFDRTSVRRTNVIDDESDYFNTDSRWISVQEKKVLKEKEEKYFEEKHSRKRTITLDFAGRRIIEDIPHRDGNIEQETPPISEELKPQVFEISQSSMLFNPMIPTSPPKYLGGKRKKTGKSIVSNDVNNEVTLARVQDSALMEIQDKGVCLSLHQPWASLLVCGIKKHEGRSWYASHRGKLWIASTAKQPDPSDITSLEQFYKEYYGGDDLVFPTEYPYGCLLGSVEVLDCVNQFEYKEKYPKGESESQYVFICDSPQELLVKFPIKGKHKLWKLSKEIHNTAKRSVVYNI